MKYIIVLILVIAFVPSHGQKWDHGFEGSENSMPGWEDWSGESGYEGEDESAQDYIFHEFIDSGWMSFSDFSDYMNDYGDDLSDDPEWQSSALDPSSSSCHDWVRRMYQWEDEIPDIRGFSWMLIQLDLSWMQSMYLDVLTLWVEYELNDLRNYHALDEIRSSFFEEFTEDFYMPVDTYFLLEDRNWYTSDVHDLIADAMSEIHDMLSYEQLAQARQIVEYMLSHPHPEPHSPYEGR
jgi:hypothetical protein